MSVVLPENASIDAMMDAAAIKSFINSDGKITEYSFDGYKKTVYSGDTVIFDGSDLEEEYIPTEEPEDIAEKKTEEGNSIGIIGGADGPTSVFISGSPIKALLAPVIISGFIFFTIGYAVGTKRYKNKN
ncbi:MAG: hypothetical protein GX154_09125 [Clostridiales bacterium]|nr:hypothetical protein [Clostridiales bacterium]